MSAFVAQMGERSTEVFPFSLPISGIYRPSGLQNWSQNSIWRRGRGCGLIGRHGFSLPGHSGVIIRGRRRDLIDEPIQQHSSSVDQTHGNHYIHSSLHSVSGANSDCLVMHTSFSTPGLHVGNKTSESCATVQSPRWRPMRTQRCPAHRKLPNMLSIAFWKSVQMTLS